MSGLQEKEERGKVLKGKRRGGKERWRSIVVEHWWLLRRCLSDKKPKITKGGEKETLEC